MGSEKLPGDYVAGFVDGEGCFALNFRRDVRKERKNKPVYFYWDIQFAIVLRSDDFEVLEKIRNTLGCGAINKPDKRGTIRYVVTNINELSDMIIPFFNKFQLHAKKRFDFELWKEAVNIFKRNQRMSINRKKGERGFHSVIWDAQDLKRLEIIHDNMRNYKSRVKPWKWFKTT